MIYLQLMRASVSNSSVGLRLASEQWRFAWWCNQYYRFCFEYDCRTAGMWSTALPRQWIPLLHATTNAVGGNCGGRWVVHWVRFQISEAPRHVSRGGAVLSLRGDNISPRDGYELQLVVNQSASAGTARISN